MQKTSIKLIKILKDAGYEAYWAGGCVRDMLLGKEPKDYDIVTNAKPDEIEKIISHTIPVGKQFGVLIAVEKGHHFEIATFRSDSGYSDGRRPDAVLFTNAKEDALRRDFTINALFFDPLEKKIYDYVGGIKDLTSRLIRFIGNPADRIKEDHLRIIRAIRLKNALNFGYHPDTYHAVKKHHCLADNVSTDRLREELNKILLNDNISQAFEDMQDTGVLRLILPEVENMKGIAQPMMYHGEGDVWTHSMLCVESLSKNSSLNVRWGTLLHDIGKPETFLIGEKRIRFDGHVERGVEIARRILKRLNFSRKDSDEILWLIEHHMMIGNFFKMTKARRLSWFMKPCFPKLMELFKADIKGARPLDDHLYRRLEKLYLREIAAAPKKIKKLLSGEDVMKILNLSPGKKVGEILDQILHLQLEGKIKNRREALKILKNIKSD